MFGFSAVTHLLAFLVDDCSPFSFSGDAHPSVDRFASAAPSPVGGRRLRLHRGGGCHGWVFRLRGITYHRERDKFVKKNTELQ